MPTFLVESYWPVLGEAEARDILDRVGRACADPSSQGAVRPLGCILLPSDGMVLFLFDAPSEAVARGIGGLTRLPFDRIVPSIHIGVERNR